MEQKTPLSPLTIGLLAALVLSVICLVVIVSAPPQGVKNSSNNTVNTQKDPKTVGITSDFSYSIGSAHPRVTVIEFMDFQCPFCKQNSTLLGELSQEYKDKPVLFVIRNFPLTSIHPYAFAAAHAGLCAKEQGKFLPMYEYLFAHQDEFSKDFILNAGKSIGLNSSQFTSCVVDQKYNNILQKDISDAQSLALKGTPTWIVNGQAIEGVVQKDQMEKLINVLLK